MRKWLLEIRNRNHMTQKQVAENSKISREFYTMIENGERNPHPETAKKIAAVLGFDWTRFFEDEEDKETA